MPRTPTRPLSGRLSRRRGLGATAAVLACAALAACGSSSTPIPSLPSLHPGRVGPQSMFTPANELIVNPAGTLDELKRLGVDSVHIYLHWADVAPDPTSATKPVFDATDPAAYPPAGWAPFDTIVRDTTARGIGLVVDLVPPSPRWAEGKGAPDPATQLEWHPDVAEFEQFVEAVATRYSGHYVAPGSTAPLPRVSRWSIWNEPNIGVYLAPEVKNHTQIEQSGLLYRGIVNAAWKALHATGHGSDTILIGEIAPAGATFPGAPGLFGDMPPLRFLRAVYCVDASYRPLQAHAAAERGCPTTPAASQQFPADNPGLFQASGFADHPYPQGLPPNQATPDEPDYAELAEVPKLERTLDTLQRVYGSNTRFPIWSTEYGYQTTPPDPGAGTVTPKKAALYLNWSEYLTWLNPRIQSYDQYLLLDPPNGVFATGLKTANGAPKPGYAAFRMPIFLPVQTAKKGHPLVVWGCVRPAHNAQLATGHPQHVQIQFQPASGGAFNTVRTVPLTGRYGYFEVLAKFPSSGNVRLAWTYPGGPEVFSRTVVVTLR